MNVLQIMWVLFILEECALSISPMVSYVSLHRKMMRLFICVFFAREVHISMYQQPRKPFWNQTKYEWHHKGPYYIDMHTPTSIFKILVKDIHQIAIKWFTSHPKQNIKHIKKTITIIMFHSKVGCSKRLQNMENKVHQPQSRRQTLSCTKRTLELGGTNKLKFKLTIIPMFFFFRFFSFLFFAATYYTKPCYKRATLLNERFLKSA